MDSKLKLPSAQNSGQAPEKPKMEPHYLIGTEDGGMVSIPTDRLEDWQEGQKSGGISPSVKKQLEEDISRSLTEVCIAAAGRVLRTVTTHVEQTFEAEQEIKSFVLRYEGVRYANARMHEHKKRAIEALSVFRESPAKTALLALLEYAVNRDH